MSLNAEIKPSPAFVRGSNQKGIRAQNERLVLTLLRQSGPLAKAEISRQTGLSAQAVSVIMRALEADGLLIKGTPVRGKVGQPSVPMRLNPDGALFLGLKIGRRSLDLVLINFLGQVEASRHITQDYPDPDAVIAFAHQSITEIIADLPKPRRARIAGLGIAMPFHLWDWAGILGVAPKALEGWKTRDITAEIAASWDFPVYLRKNTTAACGAELVFGTRAKSQDFLYFFIGFFVGGGLVLDGAVYAGRSGNAGALGSMPIGKAGGRMLQLVDVAALARLEDMLRASGICGDALWENTVSWDFPSDIIETWLEQAATGLAYAIWSSVSLVDVDCVILDGRVPAPIRAALVAKVMAQLEATPLPGVERPHVLEGSIGPEARSLGAASLPLSERFLTQRYPL